MKRFCKITTLLALILSLMAVVGCAKSGDNGQGAIDKIKKQGYITISTNAEFEPFEFKDGDQIVGIDIDIAKEIAEKLGVDLKINDVAFDALTLELRNEMSDFVIAGLSYLEDRAKNVDFSESYFSATQVVIVPKGSKIVSPLGLAGKRVGTQIGTTSATYCESHSDIGQVVYFDKSSEAISDLINGNLDAVVVDDIVANKFIAKHSDEIERLVQPVSGEEYKIAVKKGNTELLEFINTAISEMKASRKIQEIAEKYIDIE